MPLYSHSRISAFENCPLQYRYRYIDGIRKDVEGIEAFMGKTVHEVLDALYADLPRARAGGPEPHVALFNELWRRNLSPGVRIVRENMTAEDYRAIGERCVASYFRRHHPFETGEVLGRETRVEFSLDADGRYRMQGFVDRIDRTAEGVIEIHDYKTGSLPRAGALRSDRQLTLYEIAVRDRWSGVQEVRLVWHYLAHDRSFVERRGPEDLARTRLSVIRSIQRIEATVDFPARPSALCSWCEYREICPAMETTRRPLPRMDPGSGQFLLFGGMGK